MKTFLKLLVLGAIVAIGIKVLIDFDINFKEQAVNAINWTKTQLEQIEKKKIPAPPQAEAPKYRRPSTHSPTPSRAKKQVEANDDDEISDEDYGSGEDDGSGVTYSSNTISNEASYTSGSNNQATGEFGSINTEPKTELETNLSEDELFAWAKRATQTYSPNSWQLLMQYDQLPNSLTCKTTDGGITSTHKSTTAFSYLEGTSKTDVLASMGTNVHEIAHGYCSSNAYNYASENGILKNWDNVELFYYVSPSVSFFVSFPKKLLFPSKELVAQIPTSLQTFRFDTYIDGNTSTQSHGVFGLLNEFHAYYLGSKAKIDLLAAFEKAEANEALGFIEWVKHTNSEMDAFYEFDFFIREYLLYMRTDYPQNYEQLKNYAPFWQAYNTIFNQYQALNNQYQSLIISEMNRINALGNDKLTIENNTLWAQVGNRSSLSGATLTLDAKQKLLPILKSSKYTPANALRLK